MIQKWIGALIGGLLNRNTVGNRDSIKEYIKEFFYTDIKNDKEEK